MARYNDQGISGMVGPVILYTRNGKQYMRVKPRPQSRRKKPAPGTVATTSIFGLVSACGSDMIGSIRNRFLYLNPMRDLKAPKGTTDVNIKVVAAATAFDRHHYHTVLAACGIHQLLLIHLHKVFTIPPQITAMVGIYLLIRMECGT